VAASSKLCGPGVEACSSERWDGMALVDVGARTRQGGRHRPAPPLACLPQRKRNGGESLGMLLFGWA
jgi:hypothetical protein